MARAQGAPPRPAPGLWQTAAGTPDVFPPPSQRNFKETPMKSPCADLRLKSSLDKRAAQESRPPIKSTVVRCALPVLPPPVSRVPPLQGAPPPGRSRRIANLTFWAVGKRDFYRSFLKSKAARPFAYRRQKSYNDSLRRHYPRQVKGRSTRFLSAFRLPCFSSSGYHLEENLSRGLQIRSEWSMIKSKNKRGVRWRGLRGNREGSDPEPDLDHANVGK